MERAAASTANVFVVVIVIIVYCWAVMQEVRKENAEEQSFVKKIRHRDALGVKECSMLQQRGYEGKTE